ncbi:MAG: hypothetical protein ABL986_06660 [Vicinamibacterales bacterium]
MSKNLLNKIAQQIGRTIEPIVHPDASDRRMREYHAQRALDRLVKGFRQVSEEVDRLKDRVDRFDHRQVTHLEQAVQSLERSTRRQIAFSDRLLRAAHVRREQEFLQERALRRLRSLDRSEKTIIVGPWTGEVGFELLYWVPFVRWVVRKLGVEPQRLTIVSRGGTASWYGLAGARYVDVLDLRSAPELKAHMAEAKKQRTMRAFDRQILREVAASADGRAGVLHPALMYALYMPFWKQVTSVRWADQYSSPAQITAPPISLGLPKDYVAVRFYFSDCFPETEENRSFVQSVVRRLARDHEIVLLGSGVQVDDHVDFVAKDADARVHTIEEHSSPQTNLSVQTAAIAGASAFIGTYGGFSYLAPLCGVNTVAFYSENNYYSHHLDYAQRMFATVGGGSLTAIDSSVRKLVGSAISL